MFALTDKQLHLPYHAERLNILQHNLLQIIISCSTSVTFQEKCGSYGKGLKATEEKIGATEISPTHNLTVH